VSKDLSIWERIGKNLEDADAVPTMSAEVLSALRLAEEALRNSTPKCPHYPEPHSQHDHALAAVQKLLKGHPVIPS
jgi:hypothetical protein